MNDYPKLPIPITLTQAKQIALQNLLDYEHRRERSDLADARLEHVPSTLLADGIAAAEGAKVEIEALHAPQDPFDSLNYSRLVEWIRDARQFQAKQETKP